MSPVYLVLEFLSDVSADTKTSEKSVRMKPCFPEITLFDLEQKKTALSGDGDLTSIPVLKAEFPGSVNGN